MKSQQNTSPCESVIVSDRGQITLPAFLRKRLGIQAGGVLTLEERQGELILRPAAILQIEAYSDQQIAEWNQEDQLTQKERAKIRKRFLGK